MEGIISESLLAAPRGPHNSQSARVEAEEQRCVGSLTGACPVGDLPAGRRRRESRLEVTARMFSTISDARRPRANGGLSQALQRGPWENARRSLAMRLAVKTFCLF